jgi:hypothetical protein
MNKLPSVTLIFFVFNIIPNNNFPPPTCLFLIKNAYQIIHPPPPAPPPPPAAATTPPAQQLLTLHPIRPAHLLRRILPDRHLPIAAAAPLQHRIPLPKLLPESHPRPLLHHLPLHTNPHHRNQPDHLYDLCADMLAQGTEGWRGSKVYGVWGG